MLSNNLPWKAIEVIGTNNHPPSTRFPCQNHTLLVLAYHQHAQSLWSVPEVYLQHLATWPFSFLQLTSPQWRWMVQISWSVPSSKKSPWRLWAVKMRCESLFVVRWLIQKWSCWGLDHGSFSCFNLFRRRAWRFFFFLVKFLMADSRPPLSNHDAKLLELMFDPSRFSCLHVNKQA